MTDLRDKIRSRESPKKPSSKRPLAPTKSLPSAFGALDVNKKLLVAAGGIAALAALVAVTYLSDLSAGIAGQGAKVAVFTAKENLPARHLIEEADLEIKEIPKAFLAEGYFGKDQPLPGKVTIAPLAKGEIVLALRVSIPGALTGIAPKLRNNERGFVYLPDGLQEVPLVKPDDTIDLIATLPEPGTQRLISTPVLQHVRVLAVGDRFSNEATESVSAGNAAITLAVPAARVTLLTVLKQAGNLHFSLRAVGDVADSPQRITDAELERMVMGQIARPVYRAPAAAPRPAAPVYHPRPRPAARPQPYRPVQAAPRPQKPQPRVEIYNGSQKQN